MWFAPLWCVCFVWFAPLWCVCFVWFAPLWCVCLVWFAPLWCVCLVWFAPLWCVCLVWFAPLCCVCLVWFAPLWCACLVWFARPFVLCWRVYRVCVVPSLMRFVDRELEQLQLEAEKKAQSVPKKLKPLKEGDVQPMKQTVKMDAEGKVQRADGGHVRFDDDG